MLTVALPQAPADFRDLDLVRRLNSYAAGETTWHADGTVPGRSVQEACGALGQRLSGLVENVLNPVLARATARELETFTMHDRRHALKVAHLMWHTLDVDHRHRLTPSEIGLLIFTAYLHDLGMALSPAERERRLEATSELWDVGRIDPQVRSWIETLQTAAGNESLPEQARLRATVELYEAQEVVLAEDTRGRHATRERYEELVAEIDGAIRAGSAGLPELRFCASFDGDSFLAQAIDICVSHNESADALAARDRADAGRERFTRELPVGRSTADLLLVAASLRLCDILDFDRERTPAFLFHYLLQGRRGGPVDRSELEWAKHLAVADWVLEPSAVRFRIRSHSPIVHHAVVTFCADIEDEISRTRAALSAVGAAWPLALPDRVVADVHAEGYRYLPYGFRLDDQRIYELMMGRALYRDPLVAIRELLQNAVDACRLRDAHTRMNEPAVVPRTTGRIRVHYSPPSELEPATLSVSDSGTGMDQLAIENWLLRVGRSYYRSAEFTRLRAEFRRSAVDFAPVSEFGIGFMACFLLSDQVEIRTAMWKPVRGDTRVRHLRLDGPHRLIRLEEETNDGLHPFSGTEVRLYLNHAGRDTSADPPTPDEIRTYIRSVCKELPYSIELLLSADDPHEVETVEPNFDPPEVPTHLEPAATTIDVHDDTVGLDGQIVLIDPCLGRELERTEAERTPVAVDESPDSPTEGRRFPTEAPSALIRGGFVVGKVPGLPTSYRVSVGAAATLRMTWEQHDSLRYPAPTLPRTGVIDEAAFSRAVVAAWLGPLLDRADAGEELCFGLLDGPRLEPPQRWLESRSALSIFRFVWGAWKASLQSGKDKYPDSRLEEWLRGEGSELPLARIYRTLAEDLATWILPRICSLSVGREGEFYAGPPAPGWVHALAAWYDYSSEPRRWPHIVGFRGEIADLVAYEYAGRVWFNRDHASALASWTHGELERVTSPIQKMLRAYELHRPAILTRQESALLERLHATVGNEGVGSLHRRYQLGHLLPR